MKRAIVVSVVGSGGKTTFIEKTAQEIRKSGKKAAVVTTTHVRIPKERVVLGEAWEEAVKVMEEEGVVYIGKAEAKTGKMVFPGQEAYQELCARADVVLVEADGAKEKPMKFPDWSREPVIPENTDRIVLIFGLSALGKPLEEVCHRWKLGWEMLEKRKAVKKSEQWNLHLENTGEKEGTEGKILVDKELALPFLNLGYLEELKQRFPRIPVTVYLNQADNEERSKAGKWMKKRIEEKGVPCKLVQLKENRQVNPYKASEDEERISIAVIYMASGFGKRFGRNKLLERVEGKALYLHGLERLVEWQRRCRKTGLGADSGQGNSVDVRIFVVSQYKEILESGQEMGAVGVVNRQAAEGITASIRLGMESAGEADYYLFSVADQPGLGLGTLEAFIREFLAVRGQYSIGCLCARRDGGGNPVIFHRRYREELFALRGDKGGSQVMKRWPGEIFRFFAEEKELRDIDRICDI